MASAQCSSNSILSLKEHPFGRRNNEDKLATIQLGPPRPNITIKQVATKKGKSYTRGFLKNWYQRKSWLAGCEVANAVFCYPCLLFHPEGSMATTTGVKDMHHLSEKVKKHEQAKLHIDSCLKFCGFGRVNIATQLDEGYRLAVRRHNDEVNKNRHILHRLIQCVKFCGVFELDIRLKDETDVSTNPGISLELVDLVAQSDEVFDEYLHEYRNSMGTSK